MFPAILFAFFSLSLLSLPVRADDTTDADKQADQMMKAASTDDGHFGNSEKKLYQQSIQAEKGSLAHDTLDVFYHDALDYYHAGEYQQSLDLLDQIYSVDPNYENVDSLRNSIRRIQSNHEQASTRGVLEDYMRKAEKAYKDGQNVMAISIWKQALTIKPDYGPAKKRIQEVNHELGQKQFEEGYLHYHHGDLDDALDSWSNAIALDPSYKQHGLLLLMSKVQLQVNQDQIGRLTQQAQQLYDQKDLEGSLQTYQSLLELAPRNDEARRLSAKIKIQLGEAAFKSARENSAQGQYSEAITEWETSIKYGYETQRSQKAISETEMRVKAEHEPRVVKHTTPAATPSASTTASTPPPVTGAAPVTLPTPAAASPEDAASAQLHYHQGLSAFKAKDMERAVDELKTANQLDPADEHIYIALQRAEQEEKANTGSPQ